MHGFMPVNLKTCFVEIVHFVFKPLLPLKGNVLKFDFRKIGWMEGKLGDVQLVLVLPLQLAERYVKNW